MAKAVGFIEHPTGRLGNVVLQYLFLREIASELSIPYFHGRLKGKKYFSGFHVKPRYFWAKFNNKNLPHYGLQELKVLGINNFIEGIKQEKGLVIIDSSILGYTWDSMFKPAGDFLRIKNTKKHDYVDYRDRRVIALHFRGTDFEDWNPAAYYSDEYYIRAIEYCINKSDGNDTLFVLFTDDLKMNAYTAVVTYLYNKGLKYVEGDPKRDLGMEIYNMSKADVLISSPSTFAIVASLIAENQTVIHKKEWVEGRIEQKDRFWEMLEQKNTYKKLVLL